MPLHHSTLSCLAPVEGCSWSCGSMPRNTWEKPTDVDTWRSGLCGAGLKGLLPAKPDAGQSCVWLFLEFAYIGEGCSLVLEGAAIAEVLTLHQKLAQNRTLPPALPERPHPLSLFFRIWLEQILCLASTSTPESHWDMEMLNFSLNLNYPHSNIEYFISSNMRQFN